MIVIYTDLMINKSLVYVLMICLLTLSSAANAAMVCCWDMGTTQNEASEVPCHDNDSSNDMQKMDFSDTNDCKCGDCITGSYLSESADNTIDITIRNNIESGDISASYETDTIYDPPKPNS